MSKIVFITGISSGLGRATAVYLNDKGYKVYGTSRNEQTIPVDFTILKMDILDENSMVDAIKYVIQKEKRIDVLINNAGIGISGAIEETSIAEVRQQFDTNFFGLVRMTQIVLPYMRQQQNGLIINIGSLGGRIAMPFQAFYAATKFAVQGYTESMRMELMPFNIKVCVINPGDFKTSFTSNRTFVANMQSQSPYYDQFRRTTEVIQKDENSGADPRKVAKLIDKIIRKKNPRISYQVGHFHQVFLVGLKSFLPAFLLDYLLRKYYRIQ